MVKENILNYYRTFIKKSRSFFAEYLNGRRIDIFLLGTVVAILALVAVNQACRRADAPKRIDISISPQCVNLFGSDTMNALIQEFGEQNPDLRIRTADQEADIVFFDDNEFKDLINDSALTSLAPYHYTETHAEQEAAHLVLPLVSFMDLFIYNIDILEAANCDRPPKTRAEFLSAARAVEKSGQTDESTGESVSAFALGLSETDPMALRRDIYPWIWANGGDIGEIDSTDTLPRVFLDTIAFLGQLNREKLLAPDTFEKTPAQRLKEFTEGKIAMMTISARDIAFVRENAHGITFSITALPVTTLGKNRLGISGIYAGISNGCTLPDEAWRFLAFIAGKKHILAAALDAVPGSFSGTFPGEYIENDSLYSKAWAIFEAAEIAEYYPGFQNEAEVNRIIREKLEEAFKKEE